jgi:hypothetical protein
MKVFDKAKWHIEAGEDQNDVTEKFKIIFEFLNQHGLLSEEGKEVLDLDLVDSTISLNSRLLTKIGIDFIDTYNDTIVSLDPTNTEDELKRLYEQFPNK